MQAFSGLFLQLRRIDSNTQAGLRPHPQLVASLPSVPVPFFSKAAHRRSSTTLSLEPSTRTSSSKTQKRPLASWAPPPAGKRTWWETQDSLKGPDPHQRPVLGFSSHRRGMGPSKSQASGLRMCLPKTMLPFTPDSVLKPRNDSNCSFASCPNPASVLTSCVVLGNLLHFSEPCFLLCNGD